MLMTTPFTGAASGFVHATPTAQTLQDEVEFAAGLEGIPQVHDEGVTHRLQDLSLRPCVCCVLCTAHYFCLKVECVYTCNKRASFFILLSFEKKVTE